MASSIDPVTQNFTTALSRLDHALRHTPGGLAKIRLGAVKLRLTRRDEAVDIYDPVALVHRLGADPENVQEAKNALAGMAALVDHALEVRQDVESFGLQSQPQPLGSGLPASAGWGKAATLSSSGVQKPTVSGKTRQCTLQLPVNRNATRPCWVVFGWHWANDNMDMTVWGTLVQPPGSFPSFGLQPLANGSAILVAPDALSKAWHNRNDDDYAFFDTMLAQLSAGLCVNEQHIFSIGLGHGGAFVKAPSRKRASAALRGIIILDGSTECVDTPMCGPRADARSVTTSSATGARRQDTHPSRRLEVHSPVSVCHVAYSYSYCNKNM
ncbi:hypothetical protein OQA88_7988 [Cercophora sp. LCS_1]